MLKNIHNELLGDEANEMEDEANAADLDVLDIMESLKD